MGFSAQQFSAILDGLKSDGTCKQGAEQRVAPRVGLRTQAKVTCLLANSNSRTIQRMVWIRDLSATGIGLVTSERIEEKSCFVIVFEGGKDKVTVVCRVTRCQEAAKKQYFVGARFERIINPTLHAKTEANAGLVEKPAA